MGRVACEDAHFARSRLRGGHRRGALARQRRCPPYAPRPRRLGRFSRRVLCVPRPPGRVIYRPPCVCQRAPRSCRICAGEVACKDTLISAHGVGASCEKSLVATPTKGTETGARQDLATNNGANVSNTQELCNRRELL